ncbi:MAG: patatin family protein [Faecalibacterium sp.]|nr:patatin family protein [Faecalibacterium sp.]
MTGILDVGGGLRAAYGAGVLDGCMAQGILFDYCIGVSAGAANMCSYVAGQRGRNLPFYRDYSQRSEYLGLAALRNSRSLLDLDYIYGTLSNAGGENPLDYAAMLASPARLKIVATDAETGKPTYFDKTDIEENNYGILKATSCLPVVCRPAEWKGRAYFDGGVSDPIPFRRAFADGCDRLVVILTRPESWRMAPGSVDEKAGKALGLKYPAVGQLLKKRSTLYNQAMGVVEYYAAQGRIFVVAPDDCCGVETLSKDAASIERLYEKGVADAARVEAFLAGKTAAVEA